MSPIPLGGSEETHVVFDGAFPSHLENLSAAEQRALLTRLRTIAESDAPPDQFIYERIGTIDVLTFSEKGRIYSKVVTFVPEDDTEYHIVYVLYVDEDHEYARSDLAEFSRAAQVKLERITEFSTVDSVSQYLERHDSMTAGELAELLE